MYPDLQKELATFERRTPKSAEAHKKNLKRIPLGVASNYRAYDPWPIFVKEASGSKFRDLDGNEYIDHNLTFGALMAGHCHPAVMKAVEKRLSTGTMFGMPHDMEWELAEEICNRFAVEMCRVSPHAPDYDDIHNPTAVPGGLGVPKSAVANVVVATFNDLATVERRFKENPGEIAAIILEPILMNVGLCMPQPGFLKGLREICDKNGALLIFDEVKTGAKLGWGGASEYFGVHPDMICLAKSIGGGLPLAAFGASKSVMDLISQHRVFHGGTYNTNPVSMAAGLATFREVLTRANYVHVDKLGKKLADGYRQTIAKVGLQAYIAQAGANGALMFYAKEIRNYRDWTTIDIDLWRHYWFAMVNRGVMAQPYWWDEQWTISVQHTEADIDKHLSAFDDIAGSLAKAQQERVGQPVLAAH